VRRKDDLNVRSQSLEKIYSIVNSYANFDLQKITSSIDKNPYIKYIDTSDLNFALSAIIAEKNLFVCI
jgi:hypothetical protein